MIDTVINICLAILLLSLPLTFIRLIKGPTIMDRVLCFDSISIAIIGILVLLVMKWQSIHYIDIILIFSIFGFFGTVVFSYYLYKTYSTHSDPGSSDTPKINKEQN